MGNGTPYRSHSDPMAVLQTKLGLKRTTNLHSTLTSTFQNIALLTHFLRQRFFSFLLSRTLFYRQDRQGHYVLHARVLVTLTVWTLSCTSLFSSWHLRIPVPFKAVYTKLSQGFPGHAKEYLTIVSSVTNNCTLGKSSNCLNIRLFFFSSRI